MHTGTDCNCVPDLCMENQRKEEKRVRATCIRTILFCTIQDFGGGSY